MIDLEQLVKNIRIDAERRQAGGDDVDTAYHDAIVSVFKATAEGQTLDPFEQQILETMRQAERDFRGKPVPTMTLAVRLGVSDRIQMWRYLSNLEQRGLIYRPFGPRSKSGWRVAA